MPTVEFPRIAKEVVLGSKVYAKTTWTADWEERKYVVPISVIWQGSPGLPSATLRYRYGKVRREDKAIVTDDSPFTLPTLAYVRIDVFVYDEAGQTTVRQWFGVAGRLVDRIGGTTNNNSPRHGFQTIDCVGLEWLLSRSYVETCVIGPSQRVGFYPPIFNERKNKSVLRYGGAYVFDENTPTSPNKADYWSSQEIVEYLLVYHSPRKNKTDLKGTPPFFLKDFDNFPKSVLPNRDRPVIRADGNTVLQLVNSICARQRGTGFRTTVETVDNVDKVAVIPFSYSKSDIVDDGKTVLQANQNQKDVKVNRSESGTLVRIDDGFARYHAVRVRGDRAKFVFTLSDADDPKTLEKGWTAAEETEYNDGASNATGFPASAEIAERSIWNQRFRSQLTKAYRRFQVPRSWAGQGAAGDPNRVNEPLIPVIKAGMELTPEENMISDLHILRTLPIAQGIASTYKNASKPIDDPFPFIFAEPFVVFKDPRFDGYLMGGNIGEVSITGETDYRNPYQFAARVVPQPGGLNFDIEVTGLPQHVLDGANWDSNKRSEDPTIGDFDWTDAFVTVAVEGFQFCEVQENDPNTPETDLFRVKRISKPGLRVVNVAGGTVLGVDDAGELIRKDAFAIVHDDRDEARRIAKLGLQWYSADRTAITIRTSHAGSGLNVGDMINKVIEPTGDLTVDTVVTSIAYSEDVGANQIPPGFVYRTENTELDITKF